MFKSQFHLSNIAERGLKRFAFIFSHFYFWNDLE